MIIISDIHCQWEKANAICERYKDQKIILLGDLFDCRFYEVGMNKATAEWWLSISKNENIISLFGNHCISYVLPQYRCSGWSERKQYEVSDYVESQPFKIAKFFHFETINGKEFIFSHGGIHPHYIPQSILDSGELIPFLKEEEKYALDILDKGIGHHWIFNAGMSRGGPYPYGGPLWLDWEEFTPIPGYCQVVGHSRDKDVRIKQGQESINYCLDTNLRHIAQINYSGDVEIIQL